MQSMGLKRSTVQSGWWWADRRRVDRRTKSRCRKHLAILYSNTLVFFFLSDLAFLESTGQGRAGLLSWDYEAGLAVWVLERVTDATNVLVSSFAKYGLV